MSRGVFSAQARPRVVSWGGAPGCRPDGSARKAQDRQRVPLHQDTRRCRSQGLEGTCYEGRGDDAQENENQLIARLVPKAIFLDLDDTIVNDSGPIDACW